VGYRAVAMHAFGLWFTWFVDFSLVQCVAVLNVFVGAKACCLSVVHHGHVKTITAEQQIPSSQQLIHLMMVN
jgi:hypothetical protein